MIIIIGGTHHNTLSMIRSIGENGVHPDVILVDHDPKSYILASKYINHAHVCDSDYDAVSILKNNYANCIEKNVVIACSDGVASLLDLHYNKLKDYFVFFNCGQQGLLTHYMDKLVQVELAKECGFDVPVSKVLHVGRNKNTFQTYPCILKPLESIHGGKKIHICKNNRELEQAIASYEIGDTILMQQYITKDYEIVVDGVSVNGEIIIPGYIKKYRDHKGGTNYSSTHPISQLPDTLVENIKYLVRKMNYTGLFGVEIIISNTHYYFVEINLRNDATTYSLVRAGVNLPAIYINPSSAQSEDASQVREINAIVEIRDFRDSVLHRKIGLLQWWRDYKNSECTFYYTNEDPKPFYVARRMLIKELLIKLFHIHNI